MLRRLLTSASLIAGIALLGVSVASAWYAYHAINSARSLPAATGPADSVATEIMLVVPGATEVELQPGRYAIWSMDRLDVGNAQPSGVGVDAKPGDVAPTNVEDVAVQWQVSGADEAAYIANESPILFENYQLLGALFIKTPGDYEIVSSSANGSQIAHRQFVLGDDPLVAINEAAGAVATVFVLGTVVVLAVGLTIVTFVVGIALLLVAVWARP